MSVMEFIQKNILWVGMAIGSGAMLLASLIRGRVASGGVSAFQATLMINREDALVVDVRDAPSFAVGHIPNARNIPAEHFAGRVGELVKFKKKPVIVCCQRGVSAKAACDSLAKAGFERVVKLAGGMDAWEQSGQPLARS